MRVVLDSSVLIAAHISRAGVCAELFATVIAEHELPLSDFILREVRRILLEKFAFPPPNVRAIVQFLEKTASDRVVPSPVDLAVCRDPDDAPVLGTAVSARAALLVTVDKDLLVLERFEGVRIIRPGEFWRATR